MDRGRGMSADYRRSKDSNGFVEAAFDTAPASPAADATAPALSPLHAPRFPIPAEHRPPRSAGAAGTSYAALPLNSPADSAVVDMADSRRPGPLKTLPSSLYHARAGSGEVTAEKPPHEQSSTDAAAAAVAAVTPPAVDEEQWYRAQIDYVRNQVEQIGNIELQREQEALQIRSKWKRDLFLLFEDPSSSPTAFIINVFVTFMVIFSAVLTTIETIPALRKGNAQMWLAFELTIVVIFTLEFILRFLGHTDTWRQAWNHTKSAITIIDALAIFPFYIELMLRRDTTYEFRFTILRIFRLLRVFSAFKYSSLLQLSIEVMIIAIKRSSDALLAFLLFVALTVLLFSTLMYFAERGVWDEERQAFLTSEGEYSKFSSIPASAYYAIVTLTTTGFGDMTPTTFIGKLVSFPMMIAGILLIALPSIIVGRNFTQVWEATRKLRGRAPATRLQHAGGSLVEEGDDNASEVVCSSRASRRPQRRRQKLRKRSSRASRRSGSISSFETGSPQTSVRSVKEAAGGYSTVSGGQRAFEDSVHGTPANYAHAADPIDALARKDSIEMQEFFVQPTAEIQERPGGYRQVETINSGEGSDGGHGSSDSSGRHGGRASWRNEGPSSWRSSPRMARRKAGAKGKRPAGSVSTRDDVSVSRLEWEAMNAELSTLRLAVKGNEQVLRAIASHLSIPDYPSQDTSPLPNPSR